MGKTKLVAETGAGNMVASATVAALFDMELIVLWEKKMLKDNN